MSKTLEKAIVKYVKRNCDENFQVSFKALRRAVIQQRLAEDLSKTKKEKKALFRAAVEDAQKAGRLYISDDESTVQYLKKRRRVEDNSVEVDEDKTSKVRKMNENKVEEEVAVEHMVAKPAYPPPEKMTGNVTILLFYAYAQPIMTRAEQDNAISFCYSTLSANGMTGRLRVAREGFNATLTGYKDKVRNFTSALRKYAPHIFGSIDFKYVDGLPENQWLKGLKVWPVTEIVTYGFDPADAPLELGGEHLSPKDFHKALEDPNAVVIDVRNVNAIGKFAPPGDKVLDPLMRRSTEFPEWVERNRDKLEGKKILMYCTAGVRCERASAFMRNKGLQNVFQLEGGIHRYLDAFPEDGGHWVGKNYTFDKRFNHGASNAKTISQCVVCKEPWDRYQAQKKCRVCAMEVIVCKTCQRIKPSLPSSKFVCFLCA